MADDLPREAFDAGDPAADDNARREAARITRADADFYRVVMHTKPGRAWLYRRLAACHIFGATFVAGQPDVTAFQLGEENVGKHWMNAAIEASPDLYTQMIKEQREEERRLDEVRRKEEQRRREADAPPKPEELMNELPPPVGFPGGPAKPPGPPSPQRKK